MEGSAAFRHSQDGTKNYYRKLKFVLKLVGVSLTGNESGGYKIYSFLLIFFVSFLYTFLDVVEIFKHDVESVVSMLEFPIAFSLGFGKTMVFLRRRIKVGKLLDKLQQEPFLANRNRGGEMEEKLMDDCLRIMNAQTLFYWAVTALVVSFGVIGTVINRIRNSDYHDWTFTYGPLTVLNITYSPNYEITCFYQHLSVIVATIHFTTCDMITASCFAYVAFQYKILQNNIRRLVETSYQEMVKETGFINSSATYTSSGSYDIDASLIPWKYLKKSLSQVVNYHLAIISIADELEDLFNGLLLFVFLNTLGLIGFLVLFPTWMNIGGLVVTAGQLFTNCYWAEQVMHESQETGRAAYETNFVGADLRFQKSLALIMRRSQNPTILTAGKFTTVCLATFTWIIRASYSASTLVRNVR